MKKMKVNSQVLEEALSESMTKAEPSYRSPNFLSNEGFSTGVEIYDSPFKKFIEISKPDESMLRLRLQELVEKGFIRLAMKSVPAKIPPKLPGKPLSEYLKEVRE
jgi:hypothetical protein